jgi:class 3 adenylate cyclase
VTPTKHWSPGVESRISVERKLAAIFAADVEGYSRLMGQDEVGTLRRHRFTSLGGKPE